MARIQRHDEYDSDRLRQEVNDSDLYDDASTVVDSLMRDLDSFSALDYEEDDL